MPRLAVIAALVALAFASAGCSEEKKRKPRPRDREDERYESRRRQPEPDFVFSSDDAAKFVYVVTNDHRLFRFDPGTPGAAAYKLVGKMDCKTLGQPQSMAVDRSGIAWVFYDSLQLFHVSTSDARCAPTAYRHPTNDHLLGMAFTAAAPGSPEEVLHVLSPTFGLATVDVPSLEVRRIGGQGGMVELTGGIDAKLFLFAAREGSISELDRKTQATRPVHAFSGLEGAHALAFARYAGRFYVFTSHDLRTTRTTMFDPKSGEESVRDPSLDFVIVGAGQSTKVPPIDGGTAID